MRRLIAIAAVLVLAGCGDDPVLAGDPIPLARINESGADQVRPLVRELAQGIISNAKGVGFKECGTEFSG